MQDIEESVRLVGQSWKHSPYYDNAERLMHVFWREGTPFRRLFDRLDLTSALELACGHGRHSEHIVERCGHLILMDIHQENIEFCRSRLAAFANVECHVNSGHDFRPVADGSLTSIFSYDAMVHFSPDVVRAYLADTARVLTPYGMALYHHSNYAAPLDRPYSRNPQARNHMTTALFEQYCAEAGLVIEESIIMSWGGEPDLDCVSLLRL